jgi:phosphosulfolactate synthase
LVVHYSTENDPLAILQISRKKLGRAKMEDYLDFLDFPKRTKPRKEGKTSMADEFLGISQVEAVLEVFSEAIDYGKLVHIGLFHPLPRGWLAKKLKTYKDKGVRTYPGGVPFEIAAVKGKIPEYFNWLSVHGFDGVEISEDVIPSFDLKERKAIIKMALNKGLEVHTEIGKKHPDKPLNLDEAYEIIMHDLDIGVSHVVIDRSELEPYINGDPTPLVDLIKKVGLEKIMLEPGPGGWPHVHRWCIQTFGPNVNLGNIWENEVVHIEWMRRGIHRLVNHSYFAQLLKI